MSVSSLVTWSMHQFTLKLSLNEKWLTMHGTLKPVHIQALGLFFKGRLKWDSFSHTAMVSIYISVGAVIFLWFSSWAGQHKAVPDMHPLGVHGKHPTGDGLSRRHRRHVLATTAAETVACAPGSALAIPGISKGMPALPSQPGWHSKPSSSTSRMLPGLPSSVASCSS